MRRLTLILSDLYLPAEPQPGGEFPQIDELPALSWLLTHADQWQHIGDWRRWLLWQTGGQLVEIPQAAICAYGIVDGIAVESAWLATPVSLEARLDHVRMLDRGLLYIDGDERAAWCAAFNRTFGPEFSLHDCNERAFILAGLKGSASVADPARLLGNEIGPSLPGADAPELRRLWAEIEMWLHGSSLNEARASAGERRVSALWLWGRNADPRGSRGKDERDVEIYGGDPLLGALGRMRQAPLRGVPKQLAHIERSRRHVIAEFAPLTGHPQESLPALDAHWFSAARDALADGAVSELVLVANDRCFRVSSRSHWRFWRRHRSWFANLGFPIRNPKA